MMTNLRLWWALYGPAHPLESALAWSVLLVPAAAIVAVCMGWVSFYAIPVGMVLYPVMAVIAIDHFRIKRGAPPVRLRFG
jgi:hypothetical protein